MKLVAVNEMGTGQVARKEIQCTFFFFYNALLTLYGKNLLTINVRVYFWGIDSIPLVHVSVVTPISQYFWQICLFFFN